MTRCPTCGRRLRTDKTAEQRGLFHALCRQIGLQLGYTPGQIKEAIKREEFGVDRVMIGNKVYDVVRSSEDATKDEYSALINTAYRWAAEQGVDITEIESA